MIMIKMVHGINLKKFLNLISYLFFALILLFLSNSASATNPWDCLFKDKELKKADFESIIELTEKTLPLWENGKRYDYLFSDLGALSHCYQNIGEDKKFFLKFEELIDKKVISKEVYINWKDEELFLKEDWFEFFRKYLFIKQDYKHNINKKKDIPNHNRFPKNQKDWNYIKIIFEILNSEKEKNIKEISYLLHWVYLEQDYNLSIPKDEILNLLDDYINVTYKNGYYEHFIRLSRQKIDFLYGLNLEQCSNYFDKDFNQKFSKINLKKVKNYPNKSRIIETFSELESIYEVAFYCNPLSLDFAEKYSTILDYLIREDLNLKDRTLQNFKSNKLDLVFWKLNNYRLIGQTKNLDNSINEYTKLLSIFDFGDYKNIKFEKYKIENINNYENLLDKENDLFKVLNQLSNLSYEEYTKSRNYKDKKGFLFEKEKLKLEILSVYSSILISSGRKIEAAKVLKDQISFYESLRGPNKYEISYRDNYLHKIYETNQTLPDLYHQIIFLFKELKDKDEFIKYSNDAFNLCKILERKTLNLQCYRIYMSYLNGVQLFERGARKTNDINIDKVVDVINRVDKTRINFVNKKTYNNYSKLKKARFENDYIHAVVFALGAFYHSDDILDFKYRKKESAYYYVCRDNWIPKYRKNAELLSFYNTLDMAILAIKVGCKYRSEEDFTEREKKEFIDLIRNYLKKYQLENAKKEFIYLDKAGITDEKIFHVTGFLALLDDFSINNEIIKDLEIKFFENLQYEEAKFYIKTKKNFLNALIDQELEAVLEERLKLKIRYSNLVSRIYSNVISNNNQNFNIEKAKIEKRLSEISYQINKDYPDFTNINKFKIHKVNEIQNLLKDDEALLYLINEQSQQAFTITNKNFWSNTNIKSSLVGGRTKSFTDKLNKLVFKKNTLIEFKNTSALLYQSIFQNSFENIKDKKNVYIIADRHYSSFPFEMLITTDRGFEANKIDSKFNEDFEERYLIEDYNIKYLPNIDTFMNLERSNKTRITSASKFLGVGDPKFLNNIVKGPSSDEEISFLRGGFIKDTKVINERYDELPFTGKELKEIGEIFNNSSLLTREKASEKNIKDLNLKDYDVISFATHAEVFGSFKDFNEPFLVLSPPKKSSQNDDGLLTTSEISELDLNAELVILSACNTSSKSNKYAAGFSGLINSFFAAGSKSVIATHWPVEDEAGYLLMSETMKKVIKSDLSISKALQNTKIEFIKGKYGEKFKKPLFWAPYVYVGL